MREFIYLHTRPPTPPNGAKTHLGAGVVRGNTDIAPTKPREQFIVTLTPTGPGPDGHQRLRHALKILLRTCGLRCTDVRTPENKNVQDGAK